MTNDTHSKTADKIIAVASGKGGVGKTWFSVTLSHALALASRRTLLFDGDLGLANVDIQLGLMPKHDLADVITGKIGFDEAVMRDPSGGFDIVAGRSGSGSLVAIPAEKIDELGARLVDAAGRYDHLVLDLAAGVERNVIQLASLAGTCLVVTTDEPTSITDAYALVKLMAAQGHAGSLRIIINAADSLTAGRKTYDKFLKVCESFLKVSPPLAGIIRRDAKVRDAIRRQTPVLTRHPTSMAGGDVAKLTAKLIRASNP